MKAIAKSGNWEGIATRRETIRETSGRSGQGRARWSVFASSFGNLRSRIAASGEWRERDGAEGWQGERGVGGRGRNRAARSYRRQSKCNYPPPM